MTVLIRAARLVAAAAAVTALPALAQTTTVTTPAGLFTNPGPVNAAGPGIGFNQWFANNVRNNGAVGITDRYAFNGNGSIEMRAPNDAAGGSSKADFEYYFSPGNGFALSSLTGFGYDFFRDGVSTNDPNQHASLRLLVSDGTNSGALIYEGTYNGVNPAPVDTWTHVDVVGGTGNKFIWASGNLPGAFSVYNRTVDDWVALLPNLQVLGFSTGVGSGWANNYVGGVDNISFAVAGGPTRTFNFEAAAAPAVPEPATWAMMLLGFGAIGGALRTRRRRTTIAFA